MKQPFQVSLRAGEKIYLNGAVVRVDRKVTLELLNDVSFLLENHVLQPEDAKTPLRQLYFVVQTLLMEAEGRDTKTALFHDFHASLRAAFENAEVLQSLDEIAAMVDGGRFFEALRAIRRLYPIEQAILDESAIDTPSVGQSLRRVRDGSYAA